MNKITNSKLFNGVNKTTNYQAKMAKIDFNNYILDKDLYEFRLSNILSFKFPLIKEIIDSVKQGEIKQCTFSQNKTMKGPKDLIQEKYIHKSIYNLPISAPGGVQILCNLSTKGKYVTDKMGNNVSYDIPDISFYYFNLAAYIAHKCYTTSLEQKPAFFTLIAEAYAILLARSIDKHYPIALNDVDFDKVCILASCFCLESMFGLPKEEALSYSLKMKIVANKSVIQVLNYSHHNKGMVDDCDYDKLFPIDNFANFLKDEFDYIPKEKFNSTILTVNYINMYYESSGFALEHSQSFINMLILANGRLKIFDDYKINKFLEITRKDFVKELAKVISDK